MEPNVTLDILLEDLRNPPPMLYPLGNEAMAAFSGYYRLEEMERRATLRALRERRDCVAVWYRGLTLYREGLEGAWNPDDRVAAGHDRPSLILQSQLVGLGLNSAKASLDLLLAGYYSPAFSGIRHMIETFVQCIYVDSFPQEVHIWYAQSGGIENQKKTPGCKTMIKKIGSQNESESLKLLLDSLYEAWDHMSKGSHPTGEGIGQTVDKDGNNRFEYGATYQQNFLLTGFDHGFFAMEKLLLWLNRIREQSAEWKDALQDLQHSIKAIVDDIHAEPASSTMEEGNTQA